MSETKSFRNSLLYPIVFMVIVSFIFIGILSTAYRLSESRIAKAELESYQTQVIMLFADVIKQQDGTDIAEQISKGKLVEMYETYINDKELPEELSSRKAYSLMLDGKEHAYCFDIMGNGLWGSMRSLIATDTQLETIIGFSVYKQMETPGLGARIEEESFRKQFIAKKLKQEGILVQFRLIPEDQQASSNEEVRQITGATITSSAVLSMISSEIKLINDNFGISHE